MPCGILIIDKPPQWTSMDVCAKVRGMLRERRVGHAGTLDPMATGVLPVFVGRATRGVEFAAQGDKEYVAALRLGVETDTQDITGTVTAKGDPSGVTPAALEAALAAFRGDILQVPPMYSAIKVEGKKLYELARKGREVARPPRPVTIRALELLPQAPFGWPQEEDTWYLRVRCSKGTYVRTLCHDIGRALGCGGCMAALRRTMAAGFTLEGAVTMEELQGAADREGLLRPVDSLFAHLPALTLSPAGEKKVRNGAPAPISPDVAGECRVYGPDGAFLALGRGEKGVLTTVKSFFQV